MEETDDCCKCYSMRQQIEELKQKHILDFKTIKQKIISTDELIKLYQKKCQEFEKQTKYLTTVTANLDASQRNTNVIKLQLEKALELHEPLKNKCNELEKGKQNDKMEKEKLYDHIRGSENLVTQLKTAIKEREQTIESLKLESVLKTQDIDAQKRRLKRNEGTIGRLKEQVVGEKKIKKDFEKKITRLEGENDKLETEKETLKRTITDLKKELVAIKNAAKTSVNSPSPRGNRTRLSLRVAKQEQNEEVSMTEDEERCRVLEILEEMKLTSGFVLSPLPSSPSTITNNDVTDDHDTDVTITEDYDIDDVTIRTDDVNDVTPGTISDDALVGDITKNNDDTSSPHTTIKSDMVNDDHHSGHTIVDEASTIVQNGSSVLDDVETDGRRLSIDDTGLSFDHDGDKVDETFASDQTIFETVGRVGRNSDPFDSIDDKKGNELHNCERSNLGTPNKDIPQNEIFDNLQNINSDKSLLNNEALTSGINEDKTIKIDCAINQIGRQGLQETTSFHERKTKNIEVDKTHKTKDNPVLKESTERGAVDDQSITETVDNGSSVITKEPCVANISTSSQLVSKRKRKRSILNSSSFPYQTRSRTTLPSNNVDEFTSSLMAAKKSRKSLMRNSNECANDSKTCLRETTAKDMDSSQDVDNVETRLQEKTTCENEIIAEHAMTMNESSFSLETTNDDQNENNDTKVGTNIDKGVLLCVQSIVNTISRQTDHDITVTPCIKHKETDITTEDTSNLSNKDTFTDYENVPTLDKCDERSSPCNGDSLNKMVSSEDKVLGQRMSQLNIDESFMDRESIKMVELDNACDGHLDSTIELTERLLNDTESIDGVIPGCEDGYMKDNMSLSDTCLSPIPDTPEKTSMTSLSYLEDFTIPSLSPLPPSPKHMILDGLMEDKTERDEEQPISPHSIDLEDIDHLIIHDTNIESSPSDKTQHLNPLQRKYIQSVLYKLRYESVTSEVVATRLSQVKNFQSTTRFTSAVVKVLRHMSNDHNEDILMEKFHEQYSRMKDIRGYIKSWQPIVTDFEWKLSTVINHISKLFSKLLSSLVNLLWTALSHLLNSDDQSTNILGICRFFVMVARMSREGNRIRLLCYDLVKHYLDHPSIEKLFMTIALVWPEVLFWDRKSDYDVNSQPFLLTLKTIIMSRNMNHKTANDVLYKLCGWSAVTTSNEALEGVTIQLVGVLRSPGFTTLVKSNDHGCCLSNNAFELIRSIELVCSLLEWKWINNVLIRQQLWPIFDEWRRKYLNNDKTTDEKNNVEMEALLTSVLRLLGKLGLVALRHTTGNIRELVYLFSAVLSSEHEQVTFPIQIAAAKAALTVIKGDHQELSRVLVDWLNRTRERAKKQSDIQIPTQLIQRIEPLQTTKPK